MTVIFEGGGRCPSVSLKPFAKRGEQGWLSVWFGEHQLGVAHPDSAEMTVKTLGAKTHVVIDRATVRQWTVAPSQMGAERLERPRLHISQRTVTPVKTMPEVRRRPQVSHGASRRVALLLEYVCKAVNVWSARAGTQSGSVSLSYDGDPRAAYLIVDDDHITIRRVEYDIEREVISLFQMQCPDAAWIADMLRQGIPLPPQA